jgi:DNA-binding SARP family transcriptional activator
LIICSSSAVAADPVGASSLITTAGGGGHGLAVVMGSEMGTTRWHLSGQGGQIALEKNGGETSVCTAQPVDVQLTADIGSLVTVASQLDGVLPTDPPYDKLVESELPRDPEGLHRGVTDPDDQSGSQEDNGRGLDHQTRATVEDPEIEVRVLGPIEIFGAARPFTRAWAVELIVFLAMHPKGASSEQWATALWPDRIMAPASLHSTASAARRSLGVSISGEDHLPRAHGRLSLSASVESDWSRFSDLSKGSDPDSWRQALLLIRGRPFDGLRAGDWVLLEGIAANVEAVVVDLAVRYAEYCLSVGDSSEADWSARRGLQVSSYDERLYRILLRSADLAGNPAGVESVMTELVRLVAEDVEPYDAVHPETYELYRSLSRRPASSLKR